MTALGPMVYRSAHAGAVLMVVGVLQYLVGMAVAQVLYPWTKYSLTQNYVSDLGSPGTTEHALVFNTSIRILGLLAVLAAALIRSAFFPKTTARLGLVGLALAGIGAFLVGTFPEDSPYLGGNIHSLVSLWTFLFSGFALVFLGLAMVRDTRWKGFRLYTFLSGIVTWVAMGLFASGDYLGLGPGGMERVIIAPILLWGFLGGLHLLRIPRFRPQGIPSWPSTSST